MTSQRERRTRRCLGPRTAPARSLALTTSPHVVPSGPVPDLAGPEICTVTELVSSYLSAAGKRRPLVQVHLPGQAARAIRVGANLAPHRALGKRTWEEFLADRI